MNDIKTKVDLINNHKDIQYKIISYCSKRKKPFYYGIVKDITQKEDDNQWCFYNPENDKIYIRFNSIAEMVRYIDTMSRQ